MSVLRGSSELSKMYVGSIQIEAAYIGSTQFYANAFVFEATVTVSQGALNLRSLLIASGWDQVLAVHAVVTVNAGVNIVSTSTGTPSFSTGASYPADSTLSLINNGQIIGKGGTGGHGTSVSGTAGGIGLLAQSAISVTNNNRLGGGGGGGEGGYDQALVMPVMHYFHSGGGGGAGYGAVTGSGGNVGGVTAGGSAVQILTYSPAHMWCQGGNGGGLGSGGGLSVRKTDNPASPGAGGKSVSGNAYITWVATGTRNGSIT